jgi:hypothetical protein
VSRRRRGSAARIARADSRASKLKGERQDSAPAESCSRTTIPPVPDEATDNGFPSAEDVDVDALFAALREEIRRSGADPGASGEAGEDDRRAARAEAERLWPVSADRPLRLRPGVRGGIGTPAKAVLKKGMRWYVEPLAYDQRSFNAAALRLIDDLEQRVAALEAELARLRSAEPG